jgi:hypothetical protein
MRIIVPACLHSEFMMMKIEEFNRIEWWTREENGKYIKKIKIGETSARIFLLMFSFFISQYFFLPLARSLTCSLHHAVLFFYFPIKTPSDTRERTAECRKLGFYKLSCLMHTNFHVSHYTHSSVWFSTEHTHTLVYYSFR